MGLRTACRRTPQCLCILICAKLQTSCLTAIAKGWHHVDVHPCDHLRLSFLTAKEFPRSSLNVVVPISLEYQLSMEKLDKLLNGIKVPSHLAVDEEQDTSKSNGADNLNCIVIAIVESGSTIVYYYMHRGLHPPTEGSLSKKLIHPFRKDERKTKKRRRQKDESTKNQEGREKRQTASDGEQQSAEVVKND
ncbi:uncharacterized protein LOC134190939 isoform X2 [Corticium candelabrum]|uniref:uncharacterized protein LOC134190939 isoform X2 n=1 Tax=Corticium candelabrum TaxID=121492 RepID=UPI002E25C7C0|nr:uncharacterized protein LOC134190939 isoform X2 [Corticium candelabrum]